jgi:hypothetical protein
VSPEIFGRKGHATIINSFHHLLFSDCPNCVDESQISPNRWTMPLLKLGEKRYYLGIFFKVKLIVWRDCDQLDEEKLLQKPFNNYTMNSHLR